MRFCQNCGKELTEEMKFCATCGCEILNENESTEKAQDGDLEQLGGDASVPVASQEENNKIVNETEDSAAVQGKTNVADKIKFAFTKRNIIIIAAAIVVLVVVGIIVGNSISLNKYEEKLESTYDSMTYGAQIAEKYATLESKVWYNCINKKSSSETDKYTKNDYGSYYSDFNDALTEFYIGENRNYDLVELSVSAMQRSMLELKECPSKYEDEYNALKELYVAYSELTDLVVGDSSYSYNTFSKALEEAKSNYKNALSSAKLVLE